MSRLPDAGERAVLATEQCPLTALAATYGTGGTLSFALPSVATGYYWVRSRSSAGTYSSNGVWLHVDEPQLTFPVLPPAQHNTSFRIYPGQTLTGTFATGGDLTGTFVDYNTYYFFGTAGTVINASLTRLDTTKTWEDPASLDPQLAIIAPDGLIYENLRKVDDQPGVDYNAGLSGAVLPLTGIYYVRVETLKGAGDYRLSFSFASVAPVVPASRAIPFSGNFNTVPVNGDVTATSFFLDPRGYPISGAQVGFAVAGELGSIVYSCTRAA